MHAPTFFWDAFAHLGRPTSLAAELLRAALARREPGLNILLYGPPGTGKTSFAATLAAKAGARLRRRCLAGPAHGGDCLLGQRLDCVDLTCGPGFPRMQCAAC